jgi:membrane-bound serine protease (ClpP class)
MEFLNDPNVSYVLLVMGVIIGLFAIITPGTGLLELGAGIALLLAGIGAYTIGTSWWALLILITAVVPFVIAFRGKNQTVWLIATIVLITVGSIFLYQNESGFPEVNPVLAFIVAALSSLTIWVMAQKTLEAHHVQPAHDLARLIGQIGEAKTDIRDEGSVQAGGELWTARSETLIKAGASVRITGREGFVLIVEQAE